MRILVLGGTGFIGAPVVRELLAGGHEVIVTHRGRAAVPSPARSLLASRGELARARDEISGARLDAVVDLIAYTERDARETVRCFADLTARFVLASSADVYRAYGRLHRTEPGPAEAMPVGESAALRTRLHPYRDSLARRPGAEPWLADYEKILVERTFAAAPVPSAALRLGMVYGPGDAQRRFWPLIRPMLEGQPVLPLEQSWARWRGPFCFVQGAARALALAATHLRGASGAFNVADAVAHPIAEWAAELARVVDWRGEIRIAGYADAAPELRWPADHLDLAQPLVLDTARLRAELDYEDPCSTADALRTTAAAERARESLG